jgi:LacI family transcriptional regulator
MSINSDQPKAKERMDIRSVADRAKVSISTVSRTVNHVPTVDSKLAKRVRDAIRELDYHPDMQARALVTGRSGLFCLIVSESTNVHFPELIENFEDASAERGFDTIISATNNDPKRNLLCIQRMLQRKVEGVAVLTFGVEQSLLEQLAERIPLVCLDPGLERPLVSFLKVDYDSGIRQGVQHLAGLGHRKIAFISGPTSLPLARPCRDSFLRSLGECGIQSRPEWLIQGDDTFEGGTAALDELFAKDKLPTAIMCSNDETAIGVLHVVCRAGMHVPRNISIIGFHDVHMAQFMFPPLTSIQISRRELARKAVIALQAHMDGNPQREYKVDTQLIVRQLTGFPPGTMDDLLIRARGSNKPDPF